MDTSETYIKMCEKLPEDFPDKYCVNFGDYYYDRDKKEVCIHFWSALAVLVGEKIVKLHRQDQLQEILGDFKVCLDLLEDELNPEGSGFGKLLFAYDGLASSYSQFFTSFEQLWLAFVMKEKYNKVWNGEAWV